jgi:arabinosaccharide transport system substrate-binding protein
MKRLTILLLAVLCAAAGTAFAGGTGESKTASAGTELTFWTFQQVHTEFFETMVERWNAVHPDRPIVFKPEVYPFQDMHTKLSVALQSGVGAPDIADIEISKFANFLKGQIQLAPLNDLIEPEIDKFIMSRLENYALNGQYYGLDYHVGAEVMYYNNEILRRAGVDVNSIVTWKDYIEAGKKVVAATGVPMATIETTEHWSYYPLLNMAGSDVLSPDGRVILDNETNIKVLEMLYDMIWTDKIAIGTPGGFHHSEQYYGFMNDGGAASIWMPLWYINRFTDFMPDLDGKMVIRPMPVFDGSVKGIRSPYTSAGMGGTGTAVTMQSKNVQLAKEFLYFAKGTKEGSLATWTEMGFDPIRWDAWEDPIIKQPNRFTQFYQNDDIFGMMLQVKDGFNSTVVGFNYPEIIDELKATVMFSTLSDRSKTPAQALREAAAKLR